MSWWATPAWHSYEEAYGDAPGTRTTLLTSATWLTRIVDLTADETTLWAGVRGSYHAIINKAERSCGLLPVCASAAIYHFRLIHIDCAERETRPVTTWDLMRGWVEQGQLLLVGSAVGGEWRGFAAFIIHGEWAYYGFAAANDAGLNHAYVWSAMRTLKARGVRYLEMGWQGQAPDVKGQQIEFFRRGFGGYDIPVSRTVEGIYV